MQWFCEMDAMRARADLELVRRGFFDSRTRAQEAIAAGGVTADGVIVRKPSESIAVNARITAEAPHPYVSRGGLKLAAALDHFCVNPAGRACLDVGSSTGGFTDVLLRRGARHVTAVDSGTDQFHPSLRGDPRVRLLEQTDIRTLRAEDIEPTDLAVIDVSFISLKLVLPAVSDLLVPVSTIVALVKPQFEVGRKEIGKGGIVRDEAARQAAVVVITAELARLGFVPGGAIASPVTGGDGNVEYLIAGFRGEA